MQGGTHITRYTHKAEHTQGGLWPHQESCYLRGHKGGGGGLLFQEAHGVGGVLARAGSSAGWTTAWRFGRPTPPLATSLSAEPNRR